MLETWCRSASSRFLFAPIARYCTKLTWLSANKLTLIGLLIGIAIWPLLAMHCRVLATLSLLLTGLFDVIDGEFARLTSQSSPFGAALDIVSDRVVELSVVLGLFAYTHQPWLCLGLLSSILVCVTSFLIVGVFSDKDSNKSFYYSPGIMERAEAFIFFLLMIWLPEYFLVLAIGFIILTMLTAVIRMAQFRKAYA